MLTIAEKVQLLDMLKQGKSYAAVGRHYGINESTVRYIKKDEKSIRSTAAVSFNQGAKRIVCGCGDALEDDPQSGTSAESPSESCKFTASKGWFENFKKRFNLASVNLQGEAASADKAAAEKYVADTFKAIIEEGGYQPETVFNMDETALFWKRMPSRTFIMKGEAKVDAHSEPLSELDLAEMTKSDPAQEEDDPGLTLERLATILQMAKDLQTSVEEWDPQMIRSLQFKNAIDGATEVYRNLFTQMKKQRQQLPITMFLTRKTLPSTPSVEEESPDDGGGAAQSPEEAPLEQL
ncbi:tigger transposable element-derived protein 1-like [Polypterus senegalus]|uniref:tigger transposable element-derived protein 1-like n=1 Tax=Polypterus senegalus TaxID=55291 RepID=UPI001964A6DA|nr:tigger transposable element-derived protein 1-like [Polypterus senegalus]